MHPALIIDEILRLIFGFCLEQDRRSLAWAARTCKAWKDPALDFLWCCLASPEPLLFLLPSTNRGEKYIDWPPRHELLIFDSYARRVKHLNHRQCARASLPLTPLIGSIPFSNLVPRNLMSAHISLPKDQNFSLHFILSPKLERLDVDLGFRTLTPNLYDDLCNILQLAVRECPLRYFGLRGLASDHVNDVVTFMDRIPSLSLRLGRSLLPEALKALLTFSHLEELEVHTGRIRFEDLNLDFQSYNLAILPSLTKLHIQARSSLIENILPLMRPDTLLYLHIGLDDPSPQTTNWTAIFDHICSKTKGSLRHLTLEHHFEIPEPGTSSFPSPSPSTTSPAAPTIMSSVMPFQTLQMLHVLKELRHFSCDLSLPPAISDADVEKLAAWWPDVEYLELGVASDGEDQQTGMVHLTAASLASLATKCLKLRKLVLPVGFEDPLPSLVAQSPISSQLRDLTVARLDISDPLKAADYLCTLFPSLQNLEGPSDDTQPWISLREAIAKRSLSSAA